MQARRQALLLWLQSVTDSKIQQIREIRDGYLLQLLLGRVQGFSFKEESKTDTIWKKNYQKLKQIYEQLTNFLQKNTKISPPNELQYMNLLSIAKGEVQQGLQTLLYLTFLVCIHSSIKNQVIRCILGFPKEAQEELMIIIKESSFQKQEQNQREAEIDQYKQIISRLESQINRLQYQNQTLSNALYEDEQRVRKNQQLLRKLQKQNDQLSRQLLQKSQMLVRQREELMLDKYSSINEQLVQELKKQLIQRQQSYNEEIFNLKQTVSSLRSEIQETKKQNLELLDDQNKRNFIQSREDHTNCISIEKHKAKVNQILGLSKQATQKQMNVKLQNIKLKNINAELQSKVKKMNEQLHRKNNEFLVNKQDASKLKLEFFSRIRDTLKVKLNDYKLKQNNGNNYADFLQNDGNQDR